MYSLAVQGDESQQTFTAFRNQEASPGQVDVRPAKKVKHHRSGSRRLTLERLDPFSQCSAPFALGN
jgi:hypothetical protein